MTDSHIRLYLLMGCRLPAGSDMVSPQELNEVRTRLKVPPYSEDTVAHAVEENVDIMKRLYKEFQVSLLLSTA